MDTQPGRNEGATRQKRYDLVRQHSLMLAAPLSDEDCCAQSMPDASPIKWHLAHTTWFFETFVLEPHEPQFQAFHPVFRVLFNSYYNTVGDKHPRPQRGLLTRPSLPQVRDYRTQVDNRIATLRQTHAHSDQLRDIERLIEIGLQHEQQHQELMLTDVKHLLAQNPLNPAYHLGGQPAPLSDNSPLWWVRFDGGLGEFGHDTDGFCFDNELPRHRQYVAPFALASRLVTNGEYLDFMQAGGYSAWSCWLSEGWDFIHQQRITQPLYWRQDADGQWWEFTLYGLHPLDLNRPVTHVSLYEADAYARWAGARLPTEFEWEWATHPSNLTQMFGHAWQWTSSSYAPYPGYQCAPGALGEYNGKFMVNQYVLRGSSYATPAGHERVSYRNFFPAHARWQFSGVRLANRA